MDTKRVARRATKKEAASNIGNSRSKKSKNNEDTNVLRTRSGRTRTSTTPTAVGNSRKKGTLLASTPKALSTEIHTTTPQMTKPKNNVGNLPENSMASDEKPNTACEASKPDLADKVCK